MRRRCSLCSVAMVAMWLLLYAIAFSEATITKPGQYETVEEMAKWEKNAVHDIVRSVPRPPGDDADDDGSKLDQEDGGHHDDADGDADAGGGGDSNQREEKRLAGDVAEQGRLWNELTKMEKDADKMVKNAKNQRGKSFQRAEDALFDGAVRALHDVNRIDRDIKKQGTGGGGGGRRRAKRQSLRFGPGAGGGGGGGGVGGRSKNKGGDGGGYQQYSVKKRKSGASDWMITAFFLSGLCLVMSGAAYLMFRRKFSLFPRDDPVDAAFDGEGAPYQL